MTNIFLFQPQGFIFLVTVLVAGEGPSYEYEPFYRPRIFPVPTQDPLDIALRAQNSQYRSIYRNKNYFVLPPQKTTTYTPPPSTFQRPRVSTSSTTPGSTQDVGSDGSIVFDTSSPPSTYLRTVDAYQSTVVTNQVGGDNSRIQYLPTAGGKSPPPCAKNALYCEEFDNYPKEVLNLVLSRTFTPKEFRDVYGETTDNSTTTTDLKLLERTGLISSNYEETPVCSSVERTIYPRVARNKDNKWMYVVNHDEYIQGIRVEKCLDEGAPCVFGETAPAGYQTACRQKYIYKKLLALTPEGKTSTDTFKLPSCCACYIKKLPLVNRQVLNTSPAALTSKRTSPSEDEDIPQPDYDDTSDTTTTKKSSRHYRRQ